MNGERPGAGEGTGMDEYLMLLARYGSVFVEQELIPEIEKNCAQQGIYSQSAYEAFEKYKFAANSMYFHHDYAVKDIPIGQEYEAIAYSVGRKIQSESIQRCPSKVLCFFTAFRTQPFYQASRGHHELSLIQFEQGIPTVMDELVEITERKPLSTPEQRYIYLGTESVLKNLVSRQEAEEAAVDLLEKSGLSGEESFYKLDEEESSAIYEMIKRLTVERYGLDERYTKDILFTGLWKLHMKNRS